MVHLFLIIEYIAFHCTMLVLSNVGKTFRMTTILGHFDKMTYWDISIPVWTWGLPRF